ncbi:MAG: hypothetical protein R3B90_14000 [Planctomycetaceae bacterium]
MKRFVPLLITAIGGLTLIIAFFIPAWQKSGEVVAVWFDILASIAFLLGGGNLLKVHLKKMSDRGAGWGYSAVTVFAFLATLAIGLFKLGSTPAENTENYGESFAPLPLASMPLFEVPGSIPSGDDAPLPASVREQLSESDSRLKFRGWMTGSQMEDLIGWQDSLAWRAAVEELHEQAQPPERASRPSCATMPARTTRLGWTNQRRRRSRSVEQVPNLDRSGRAFEGAGATLDNRHWRAVSG